jgi:hypothetical protein
MDAGNSPFPLLHPLAVLPAGRLTVATTHAGRVSEIEPLFPSVRLLGHAAEIAPKSSTIGSTEQQREHRETIRLKAWRLCVRTGPLNSGPHVSC